jgi:hypothetical protein
MDWNSIVSGLISGLITGTVTCWVFYWLGGSVRTDATMMRLVCETPQRGVTLSPSASSVGRSAPDE